MGESISTGAAKLAVLALAKRFHETSELRKMLSKAARATGLSISLGDYLETLARGRDLEAYCFRWAARAARGEDVATVAADWNPTRGEVPVPAGPSPQQ